MRLENGERTYGLKVARQKDVRAAKLDGQLLLSFRAAQLTLQPRKDLLNIENTRSDVRIIERGEFILHLRKDAFEPPTGVDLFVGDHVDHTPSNLWVFSQVEVCVEDIAALDDQVAPFLEFIERSPHLGHDGVDCAVELTHLIGYLMWRDVT